MKHGILFVFCWITQQSALWKQNKNVIWLKLKKSRVKKSYVKKKKKNKKENSIPSSSKEIFILMNWMYECFWCLLNNNNNELGFTKVPTQWQSSVPNQELNLNKNNS